MQLRPSTEIRRATTRSSDPSTAARELREALIGREPQPGTAALAIFFASPEYDLEQLAPRLALEFGDVPLVGCTTGAEIGPEGYGTGTITGLLLPAGSFQAEVVRLDGLSSFDVAAARAQVHEMTARLDARAGRGTRFGFLLIDGLSVREELVASTLHGALGGLSLFGGSAGDGLQFRQTFVYHAGRFHQDAAVLSCIQTELPFEVFKTQHFASTDRKFVVTEADPVKRIVREIDGEPATQRYARAVGVSVEELTPVIFSSHPVVVRIGGSDFVRSIQCANEDGSLTFLCAIDEGIVLSVSEPGDVIGELERAFSGIRERIGPPQLVLGCDCILRNLEISQRNMMAGVEQIFRENNLVGFSTYGEQFDSMHVNQTLTGVAIGCRTDV